MVRVHFKMKAAMAELTRKYEADMAAIKEQHARVLGALHSSLLENKVKSMATGLGTFYFEKDAKISCTDWGKFRAWMIENDAMDFVEKRVSKKPVMDFMAENEDEAPPGIAALPELVVRVRSSKK
jgi:hypothetical protein